MSFPCDFPIKIIGNNRAEFAADMTAIVRRHFPQLLDQDVRSQPSQSNNYLALTVTVRAEDQAGLDALYQELSLHPDTKMVL